MDNLLFYTLLGLTAYYFMVYLPNQKTSPGPKSFTSSSTQTEPISPELGILNCPGSETVQLPSDQTIPDPEVITKLEKDIAQKERTQMWQAIARNDERLNDLRGRAILEHLFPGTDDQALHLLRRHGIKKCSEAIRPLYAFVIIR